MTTRLEQGREKELGLRLLLVLGLLSAAGPLAMDFYLASLPGAQVALQTSPTAVQLTVTGFLIGLGIGQLGWGPVSDRFGRRTPLLVGCSVAVLASVAAVAAPSVGFLIAARFVQALAASAGVVMSRAVIADRLVGQGAARAMSLMMTINSVAPVVAPLVGGALAGAGVPWRAVLGVVLATMVVQLVTAALVVEESLPAARRTTRLRLAHIGPLLRRPAFVGYSLTSMFTFGTGMAYISSSSFVYQRVIGSSAVVYGVAFALNASGMIVAGLVSARAIHRGVTAHRLVALALPVLLVSSAIVLAIAATPTPKWPMTFAFLAMQTAMGFVMGNCAALAIGAAREVAGSASGVLGSLNFLFGGAVSSLGGLAGSGTAVPLGIVMTGSALGAASAFAWTSRVADHKDDQRLYQPQH
ncbi:MAG: multidrug effflux MFS transporter [Nocardioidaceae bacterium]|nr:multidrug effflux MFS transporter [Nocardioidaceae bacterium]